MISNASATPGVAWRKSTYSGTNGDCIEVGEGLADVVPVRDSKDPHGPALVFTPDAFTTFVEAVKAGQFPAL